MITYLSSPKPFVGESIRNQRNAILSWLRTGSDVEVILYGRSEGIQNTSRELGTKWVPDIASTELGTPLFGAIVEHASRHAKFDVQVYLNCDILLSSAIVNAVRSVQAPQFLMIGQRIDLTEGCSIDTGNGRLLELLGMYAKGGKVTLHPEAGSDYFIFRRGLWADLPEVAIGRGGYDNVLIAYCLKRRIPVIDATFSIPAVHQFHEYGHLDGGSRQVFSGPEALRNLQQIDRCALTSLADSTWQLREHRLHRAMARGDWLKAIEMELRLVKELTMLGDVVAHIRRVAHHFGISRPRSVSLPEVLAAYSALS